LRSLLAQYYPRHLAKWKVLNEFYITRITGTCNFCLAWVRAIAQRTLKELCGWWRYWLLGGAIAAELVVDASLVEKDWYAIRIIAAISRVKHPAMRLVFSGGTSLAKGYGLIQRFSEDIDFKVAMSVEGLSRGDFREYRERIVEAIRSGSED
jgi:Nucleotidyl transferase AbiEii toxin, Type IV TA system